LIFEVVDNLSEAFGLEKSLYFQGPAKEVHKANTEDLVIVSDQNRPSKLSLAASPHGFAFPPCNRRGEHYAPLATMPLSRDKARLMALPKLNA